MQEVDREASVSHPNQHPREPAVFPEFSGRVSTAAEGKKFCRCHANKRDSNPWENGNKIVTGRRVFRKSGPSQPPGVECRRMDNKWKDNNSYCQAETDCSAGA